MFVHLVSGQKTRRFAYLLVHKHLNKLILQKSSYQQQRLLEEGLSEEAACLLAASAKVVTQRTG